MDLNYVRVCTQILDEAIPSWTILCTCVFSFNLRFSVWKSACKLLNSNLTVSEMVNSFNVGVVFKLEFFLSLRTSFYISIPLKGSIFLHGLINVLSSQKFEALLFYPTLLFMSAMLH